MKYFYVILFCLLSLIMQSNLHAQEIPYIPRLSQYMFNGLILNPAYAGSRDAFSISGLHKDYLSGFEGAPVNQKLSLHTPLKNDKVALGITVDNFTNANTQYNSLMLSYAYRVWLGGARLSMGLRAGGYYYSNNFDKLDLRDAGDPAFYNEKGITPNFGAGFYLFNQNYYIGLSVPFFLSKPDSTGSVVHDFENYNFIFTAGYVFDFSQNFKIKPAVIVDYGLTAIDYQAGFHFILFNDVLWLGAAYKKGNEVSAMIETQINRQLKIGYAYDYSFTDLSKMGSNTHEIMLRYELKFRADVESPFYF
jgi:type IX secretion system PorP/SprF family membrane protein